jgi:hypothetical protein
MGVITLNAAKYREIAEDPSATGQAALIVIVAHLIAGFFGGLVRVTPQGTTVVSAFGAITGAIVGVIFALVGWVLAAWVLAFVARGFGGKTNTGEMLRVTGYVEVFAIIGVLSVLLLAGPILQCIVGLVSLVVGILRLIGYIVGVREAGEFSTGNAIITAIIAAIVNFIIVVVIGGAIVGLLLAGAAVLG